MHKSIQVFGSQEYPNKGNRVSQQKLQEKDARALLKAANSLIAAKGKKVEEFDTREKISKDSVAAMLGATGNMRAPTIVAGKKLIVGFNEEVFEKAFG